jgi:Protein of unknown function (DUF3341)
MSEAAAHGEIFVPQRFVLAEFPTPEALLEGTRKMREKGWRGLDTHTPYPVNGIEAALGLGRARIPTIVLGGAIAGALLGYGMMFFMNAVDFPINIGNRPPHSPPAFIPITFELAVLLGGSAAFFGSLFGLFKFPTPYHPLFESEAFKRASIDGFFLSVEVPENKRPEDIMDDARLLGAVNVEVVEERYR